MVDSRNWLHLFSSNIRELYIADAIDLLAAPTGSLYQFRYQREHVQDEAAGRWSGRQAEAGGLRGFRVITYYSLQHPANFHPAAYIPLRQGEVVDAYVNGQTHVVVFRLHDYAPLQDPEGNGRRDAIVQNFSKRIRTLLSPSYPDYADERGSARPERRSAAIGEPPDGLIDSSGDEGAKFERVVRYMSDALGSQQPRLFFRVASIVRGNRNMPEELSEDGYLEVVAGNQYRIDVAHYQPFGSPSDTSALHIESPRGLDLLTPPDLPLKSRYDIMQIELFSPFRDDEVQGQLSIGVKEPARGARVRIPLRIAPSITHTVAYPTFAILGGICALMPAILGANADLNIRLGLVAFSAILLGFGTWARRNKGLAS